MFTLTNSRNSFLLLLLCRIKFLSGVIVPHLEELDVSYSADLLAVILSISRAVESFHLPPFLNGVFIVFGTDNFFL